MTDTASVEFRVTGNSAVDKPYISGCHPLLGAWDPAGIDLVQRGDHWHAHVDLPRHTPLQFKITDGTWHREARISSRPAGENLHLFVERKQQIHLHIDHWSANPSAMNESIKGSVDYLGQLDDGKLPAREILVWLPTQYRQYPQRRFPVLYMHDGQNILDPQTAFLGSDWRVDETIEALVEEQRIKVPPIVVGIYNTAQRLREYNDGTEGKRYLDFIVNTVKPLIDDRYRTRRGRADTATMGSSMGGLISFLACWHYPQVFGQAACLSPMFWGKRDVVVNAWKMVEDCPRNKLKARLYLDNGDVGLERMLMPGCRHMLRVLKSRGYTEGENLQWFLDKGALHTEQAWADRLWRPLTFLYGQ